MCNTKNCRIYSSQKPNDVMYIYTTVYIYIYIFGISDTPFLTKTNTGRSIDCKSDHYSSAAGFTPLASLHVE